MSKQGPNVWLGGGNKEGLSPLYTGNSKHWPHFQPQDHQSPFRDAITFNTKTHVT